MPSSYSELFELINPFFNPKKIALIGASADNRKLGNSILMNLLSSGVDVFPITNRNEHVLGVKTYQSLADLPEVVDLVIVAVAARHCPSLMQEIRNAGARNAVIISGGFSETGSQGKEIENDMINAARDAGVRFIGPNCVGVSNTALFNGTFTMMPEQGNIAFVSQSGALGGMSIYNTRAKRIGMSKFASVGNAADIGFIEIIDYFRQDPKSTVIAMYIEGITKGKELFESLRRAAHEKPVVVLKGGKSDAGSRATQSHTGSIAGSAKVFDGMIRQAGCVTAPTLDTLFEVCKLFDYQPLPKGCNIGIISNTGGAGVLATDALAEFGLALAPLKEETHHELRQALPPMASLENPVDIVASGGRREYRIATELLLKDPTVHILLVICGVPTFAGMTQTEHAVGTLEAVHVSATDKPVIGVWMAGNVAKPGKEFLEMNRIPCFDDPSIAALCVSRIIEYAKHHSHLV